jgi:hypothetical protein
VKLDLFSLVPYHFETIKQDFQTQLNLSGGVLLRVDDTELV